MLSPSILAPAVLGRCWSQEEEVEAGEQLGDFGSRSEERWE